MRSALLTIGSVYLPMLIISFQESLVIILILIIIIFIDPLGATVAIGDQTDGQI